MGDRSCGDKRGAENFSLDPFNFKGLLDFSCLRPPTVTARTAIEIKTRPETIISEIPSPSNRAEDKTPNTGTPSDPRAGREFPFVKDYE